MDHPPVCWERVCVCRFRWCVAERPYDILYAILRGLAHYQTPVTQNMNDGVTTYRQGERYLRVLHSDLRREVNEVKAETHAYTHAHTEVSASESIMKGGSRSGIGMISSGALNSCGMGA